jgi:hypothetical protein
MESIIAAAISIAKIFFFIPNLRFLFVRSATCQGVIHLHADYFTLGMSGPASSPGGYILQLSLKNFTISKEKAGSTAALRS